MVCEHESTTIGVDVMGGETRAVVFDRPADDASATRVATIQRPAPGPGQVLVEVAFAGINFKDVMARRGDAGYVDAWPFIPGLEVAGSVASCGPGVDEFTVGQQVVALTNEGGLAEAAIAETSLVVPRPPGLEPAIAAVTPGALTTAELLVHDYARVRAGDTVVVSSASGAVGVAIALLARSLGDVALIGVVGAHERRAAAERAGFDHVAVRGPSLVHTVRDLAPRGADVVLDPQGTAWLETDVAMLRPAGRVVLFGNAGGGALAALPPAGELYAGNTAIGGFSLKALSATEPERIRGAMTRVMDRLAAGSLAVDPIVLEGLSAAAAAQQRLADGTGAGKYVIKVR